MKEPYFLKKPTSKVVGKDRVAIIGKSLSEFIEQYKKETECYISRQDANDVKVPKDVFEAFLSNASETGYFSGIDSSFLLTFCYFRY